MLITGACGFVGSVFADYFQEADLVDNLTRDGAYKNYEKYKNLERNIYLKNIQDFEPKKKYKTIIHCASNPSVLEWEENPKYNYIESLKSTISVCEMAKEFNATLIFISSSRVYPITAESPIRENSNMIGEKSHYGASKLIAESIIQEYNISSHIFRCGLLAGAGQFGKKTQGIVSFWINQWKHGGKMEIFGFGGEQKRDVLHPRDMIDLVSKASKTRGKTLCNISGGIKNSFTLNQLSEFCSKRIGKRNIIYKKERIKDKKDIILDISLANSIWGWKPKTTKEQIFEEILKC